MFWSGTNLICIHKLPENSYSLSEENRNTDNDLVRQHAYSWSNKIRGYGSSGRKVFFTSVTGFCNKSREIFDDTNSGDRIPWDDNKLKGYDDFPPSRNVMHNKIDVSRPFHKPTNYNCGIKKGGSWLFGSTISAILQVKLHCCFLQHQQTQVLKKNSSIKFIDFFSKVSQTKFL